MEKFKSQSELKQAIVDAFNFNKDAKKLHVVNDGQCFLDGAKNAADNHARRHGLKVTTVNREDYVKVDAEETKKDSKDNTPSVPYEGVNVTKLKEELTLRTISFDPKAKRDELVALLVADDEAVKPFDFATATIEMVKEELTKRKIDFELEAEDSALVALLKAAIDSAK